MYHTTCSPPYHQHLNKGLILQSWSWDSSGPSFKRKRREITGFVCMLGQTQCFCFCRAWPGLTTSFLLAPACSTEPWLSIGPAGRVLTTARGSEHRTIQLEGKQSGTCHETWNRAGTKTQGFLTSAFSQYISVGGAETHRDTDWNSVVCVGKWERPSVWLTGDTHSSAYHGDRMFKCRHRGAQLWLCWMLQLVGEKVVRNYFVCGICGRTNMNLYLH